MLLLVIGGVAAGLSAAARARRIDPSLEIVVLEKGADISYGACGLPYYLEGRVRRAEELIVHTPEYFRKERNIAVRTGARVVSISHPRREVTLDGGERVHYDRLVIATGARPRTKDFEGATLPPHVFTLHTLEDAERLKAYLCDKQPKQAVVVGAGYIGLEAADALRRNGMAVTVVEQRPAGEGPGRRRVDQGRARAAGALPCGAAIEHAHLSGGAPRAGDPGYRAAGQRERKGGRRRGSGAHRRDSGG